VGLGGVLAGWFLALDGARGPRLGVGGVSRLIDPETNKQTPISGNYIQRKKPCASRVLP
jgi:hypothetical protein